MELEGAVSLNALFEGDSRLTIRNGTTFFGAGGIGAGTVTIQTYGYAGRTTLDVVGTSTLANVTLNLGGTGNFNGGAHLLNDDFTGVGAVLTLAPSVTINQVSSLAEIDSSDYAGDRIVNQGVINAGFDGGQLTIDATHFINAGTIIAANNDEVALTGAVAASLVNSIRTTTGGEVSIAGTATGGTINGPLVGSSNGTLDGRHPPRCCGGKGRAPHPCPRPDRWRCRCMLTRCAGRAALAARFRAAPRAGAD